LFKPRCASFLRICRALQRHAHLARGGVEQQQPVAGRPVYPYRHIRTRGGNAGNMLALLQPYGGAARGRREQSGWRHGRRQRRGRHWRRRGIPVIKPVNDCADDHRGADDDQHPHNPHQRLQPPQILWLIRHLRSPTPAP